MLVKHQSIQLLFITQGQLKHYCTIQPLVEIRCFFVDIAMDLLVVRSGSSVNMNVGLNIVLQTPVNID